MSRDLTSGMLTEIAAQVSRPILLIEIPFKSQTVRITDAGRDVTWNSQTWIGNGWFQSMEAVEEGIDLSPGGLTIEMGGASSVLLALILTDINQVDKAKLWLAMLDDAGAIVADPYQAFSGWVDVPTILDSTKEATVTITFETDAALLGESSNFRYTGESQKALFSGDLGFDSVEALQDWSGFWGHQTKPPKKKKEKKDKKKRVKKAVLKTKKSISKRDARPRAPEPPNGKDVTFSESASSGQIIYGRVRCEGMFSFLELSADSKASVVAGSGDSQILFMAVSGGAVGNNITITIVLSGTQASTAITVTGNDISIRLKSSSGVSQATADDVITAVRASGSAAALVSVTRGSGNGTGLVAAFSQTNLKEGGGTWFYQIVTLACHEIDAIEQLWFGDRQVFLNNTFDSRWASGSFDMRVFMALNPGTDSQVVQPDLNLQLPTKWTSNHRQRGCAHVGIILVWDPNVFAEGQPDMTFLVRGRKCYDPRSGLTVWTQNAALIAADYLTNTKFGMGVAYADIDETVLIAAANTCDETVQVAAGGTEPRYQINGRFDTSTDHETALSEMAAAMAGDIFRLPSGKWLIQPGAWRAPAVTYTEDDLRGDITVTTARPRSERANCFKGTFVSPAHKWEETDYPVVKNVSYIAEDGKELYRDFSLPLVTSSSQCQRIAKIEMLKNREGISMLLPMKLNAWKSRAGEVININFTRYGWTPQAFEIQRADLVYTGQEIGVDVDLVKTSSAVYDFNHTEENPLADPPDRTVPSPYTLPVVSGLALTSGTSELYVRGDGTVFSRLKISWTETTDVFIRDGGYFEIQCKKSSDVNGWPPAATVPGTSTFYHVVDVQDGEVYDVRVRAVSALRVKGSWAESFGHIVVGKTAAPADVLSLSASVSAYGITISWPKVSDLDLDYYEIREGASWAAGNTIANTKSDRFLWDTRTAGTYTLRIKARDTSGNYSTNEATSSVVIAAPSAPGSPTITVSQNVALLSWAESSSQFQVRDYEIRHGASFAGGTSLGIVSGTTFSHNISWLGDRTFWIAARDIAGNVGTASQVSLSITAPGPVQNLNTEVVSNTVLLKWAAPATGSLPIREYKVRKGATFAGASVLGTVSGTFKTHLETIGGQYIYWVTALDWAGNESSEMPISTTVYNPTGFELRASAELDPASATLTRCLDLGNGSDFLAPVNVTETWAEHYTNNSKTTVQGFIDASFTRWLQPTPGSAAVFEKEVDLGITISQSLIAINWIEEVIAGSCTVTPRVSYKTNSGDAYTDGTDGERQIFASNFRYIKIKLTITGATTAALSKFRHVNYRVEAQEARDGGTVSVYAADSGGTTVTFNKSFADITELWVSAQGTTALIPVRDFSDVPNPTSFKILLFNTSGVRQDGTVTWGAKGYEAA